MPEGTRERNFEVMQRFSHVYAKLKSVNLHFFFMYFYLYDIIYCFIIV